MNNLDIIVIILFFIATSIVLYRIFKLEKKNEISNFNFILSIISCIIIFIAFLYLYYSMPVLP